MSCLFRLSFQPSWTLGRWSWWRMRRCQKLVPIVFQGRQQNSIWCQYYLTRMPFMLVSTNFRWPVASSQLFFFHLLFSAWWMRFRVPNLGLGFKMFSCQLLWVYIQWIYSNYSIYSMPRTWWNGFHSPLRLALANMGLRIKFSSYNPPNADNRTHNQVISLVSKITETFWLVVSPLPP